MLNSFILALLATAVGVADATCNQDNCLRAVIASAFTTRSGSADCASYFRTTVTPATVTYYSTLSQTVSTTTSGTAFTVTTTTVTEPTTATQQTIIVSVETDFVTVLAKRQQTSVPSSIPAYASACSGAVRYSSACSCLGASQSTVTAVTPSTTIIVTQIATETSTYSTTSTSTTVETDFSTITDTQTIVLSSTTTATSTSTTVAPRAAYQTCTGPPFNSVGTGGCSSNCFCDSSAGSSTLGFCDNANSCGNACTTDADCPNYSACTNGHPECGGNVCLSFAGCGPSTPAKMMAIRGRAVPVALLRGTNIGGSEA